MATYVMRQFRTGVRVVDANDRVRRGIVTDLIDEDTIEIRVGRGTTPFQASVDPDVPRQYIAD